MGRREPVEQVVLPAPEIDPPKHPGGRPTKYDPNVHPQLVYATARYGGTLTQIAAACDVHRDTVIQWRAEHPEFSDAISRVRDACDSVVESSLFEASRRLDVKAASMWLSNRRRGDWTDNKRLELTGADGGPIAHEAIDTAAALDQYAADFAATLEACADAGDSESDTGE